MISVTATWSQSTDRGRNCCLPTPTVFVMMRRPMICIAISYKTWNTLTRQNTRENISCIVRETKKVLGKMKDETHGVPIEEFIGLRPKMHSVLFAEENHLTGGKENSKRCFRERH